TMNGRGWFRTSDLSRVKSAQPVATCCRMPSTAVAERTPAPPGWPSVARCWHLSLPRMLPAWPFIAATRSAGCTQSTARSSGFTTEGLSAVSHEVFVMYYRTFWIVNKDLGEVAAAVDRHLADKPPTSIVAVNFSTSATGGVPPTVHSAAVTIRYE